MQVLESVPPPASPPEASFVAVEPVSHVTDGFDLAARTWRRTGVTFLPPGGRCGGGFRLRVTHR